MEVFMKNSNKLTVADSLLSAGIISGGIGLFGVYLVPSCAQFGYGLMALGGWCFYKHFSQYSKFDKVFKALNLGIGEAYPILNRKTKHSGYDLYAFTLPAGMSIDDFEKNKDRLEYYLRKRIDIDYGFKELLIKVFPWDGIKQYEFEPMPLKGAVELLIGHDRYGDTVTVDLSKGEPHLLCAGETGGGKSNWIDCVLTNIIVNKRQNIDLFLIDLKEGVEFRMFENCDKVKGFAYTEETALKMLYEIDREVTRRGNLLRETRARNITEYNEKSKSPLKYQLLVIDEFAMLKEAKEGIHLLEKLSAKARFVGIHILLLTQRPSADVVTGLIKCNIPVVLGLKTSTAINSRIIMDSVGLEDLKGEGHGILKKGIQQVVIQTPFLSSKKADELLKPHIHYKPKEEKEVLQIDKEVEDFSFMEDM